MNNRATHATIPLWEKLAGVLGFCLLAGSIAFLIWKATTEKHVPPQIDFAVQAIDETTPGYHVQVEVYNRGSESVAGLFIRGQLQTADGAEEVNAEIDYVPSNSRRDIGLFFNSDPRAGSLELKALGYQKP